MKIMQPARLAMAQPWWPNQFNFWLSLLLNLTLLINAAVFLLLQSDGNEYDEGLIAQDVLKGNKETVMLFTMDSFAEVQPNPELDAPISKQIKNRSDLKDEEQPKGESS